MADLQIVADILGNDHLSPAARSAIDSLGDLDSAGNRSAGHLDHLATAAVAAGAAIAGAFVVGIAAGVKAAGDLEQAVANISTIKPEIDTSDVFAALNEMQTRVPQSAAQLGDSLYNVFSSINVTQEEGLQLVEKFAKGAVGAATDAQTFGTAALGVMNAYGLSVKDADHISDVFFNTVNAGVVTGQELAANLGLVTQSAKLAGVNVDELGGFIAGVTKEGGPAAQNMNNLNNLFLKITTKEAQKELHDLGVATVDSQGQFLPLTQVFTDLKERMAGMTDEAKVLAIQKIFPDLQARAGATVIMDQLDFVKDAIAQNVTATGVAEDAYAKMSDTFNAQSKLLMQTFTSILTTVGSEVLPAITPVVKAFSEALPQAFNATKEALAPVGQFMGELKSTISGLANDSGITGITGVLAGFSLTLKDVFGPNTSQLFDRITQAIGNLFEKIGSLVHTGQGELGSFTAFIEQMSGVVLGVFDAIGKAVDDFQGMWANEFVEAVQGGVTGVINIFNGLGDVWRGALEDLATIATDIIHGDFAAALQDIGALVLGVLTGVEGLITDNVPAIGTALAALGTTFVDWVKDAAPQVMTALVGLLTQIGSWIEEQGPILAGNLATWVLAFWQWAGDVGPPLLQSLLDMVGQVLDFIATSAGPIAGKILTEWVPAFVEWVLGTALPQLLGNLFSLIGTVADWLVSGGAEQILTAAVSLGAAIVSGVLNGVGRLEHDLREWIKEKLGQAIQFGTEQVQSIAAQGGEQVAGNIIAGVVNGIGAGIGAIGAAMGRIIQAAITSANQAGEGHSPYKRFADEVGMRIAEGIALGIDIGQPFVINQIGKTIEGLLTEAWKPAKADQFGQIGYELINQLVKAMETGSGAAIEAVGKAGQGIIAQLKAKLSPEEAEEWSGRFIAAVGAAIRGDTSALEAVGDLLDGMRDRLEQEASAGAGFAKAVVDATGLAGLQELFGTEGAKVAQAFTVALTTNTDKAGEAVYTSVQSLIAKAQEKGVPDAIALGEQLQALIAEALANLDNPEVLARVNEGINNILTIIGTGFADLKPHIVTPVEAAMSAISEVIRDADWVQQFGSTGGAAVSALTSQMETGSKDAAVKAANLVQKMIAEAQKAGVVGAVDLGNGILETLMQTIESHDPELLEDFKGRIALLNQAIEQVDLAKASEKLAKDLGKVGEDLAKMIGKWDLTTSINQTIGDAFAAGTKAIADGSDKNLEAFAAQIPKVAELIKQTYPADLAQQKVGEMFDAWQRVMAERTPEAIQAMVNLVLGVRQPLLDSQLPKIAQVTMEGVTAQFEDIQFRNRIGTAQTKVWDAVIAATGVGGQKNVAALQTTLAQFQATAQQKLKPEQYAQYMNELWEIIRRSQTEEGTGWINDLRVLMEQYNKIFADGVNNAKAKAAEIHSSLSQIGPPGATGQTGNTGGGANIIQSNPAYIIGAPGTDPISALIYAATHPGNQASVLGQEVSRLDQAAQALLDVKQIEQSKAALEKAGLGDLTDKLASAVALSAADMGDKVASTVGDNLGAVLQDIEQSTNTQASVLEQVIAGLRDVFASIPRGASGLVFNGPTLNIAGEGGETEVLSPVSTMANTMRTVLAEFSQRRAPGPIDVNVVDPSPVEITLWERMYEVIKGSDNKYDAIVTALQQISHGNDALFNSYYSIAKGANFSLETVSMLLQRQTTAFQAAPPLGGTREGTPNITIHVHGDVLSERNLIDAVKRGLALDGNRNGVRAR